MLFDELPIRVYSPGRSFCLCIRREDLWFVYSLDSKNCYATPEDKLMEVVERTIGMKSPPIIPITIHLLKALKHLMKRRLFLTCYSIYKSMTLYNKSDLLTDGEYKYELCYLRDGEYYLVTRLQKSSMIPVKTLKDFFAEKTVDSLFVYEDKAIHQVNYWTLCNVPENKLAIQSDFKRTFCLPEIVEEEVKVITSSDIIGEANSFSVGPIDLTRYRSLGVFTTTLSSGEERLIVRLKGSLFYLWDVNGKPYLYDTSRLLNGSPLTNLKRVSKTELWKHVPDRIIPVLESGSVRFRELCSKHVDISESVTFRIYETFFPV